MQTTTKAEKLEHAPVEADHRQIKRVNRAIHAKSFAVLSTVSSAGFPHAAGVVYASNGTTLYVHTMRSSRKACNIVSNSRVGVVIPVRRIPVGPPFTVQFQGSAEVLQMDDPEIVSLLDRRQLKNISGHGALDEPDGCFLRIRPGSVIHTYGIGVSTIGVARDPLHSGARAVRLA
jgi:general stress protein 26